MMSKEEVEHLVRRSKEFFETAKYQITREFYNLAAFNLEQAAQLYLKARILENGANYPRTHSLRALIDVLKQISGKTAELEKFSSDFMLEISILEDAYITSRYIPRTFGRAEVERLLKAVEELMKIV